MMEAQRVSSTPPSDVRAVIFDWDQTLWDSWTLHLNAIKHAADFVGRAAPSAQHVLDTFGGTLEDHLQRIYGSRDGPMLGYLQYYRAQRLTLARLFPGVADVLAALRAAGYKVAVLSDKVESRGLEEVALAELDGVLHAAVFRDGSCPAKPEPDSLLRTLDTLGVNRPRPSTPAMPRGTSSAPAAPAWRRWARCGVAWTWTPSWPPRRTTPGARPATRWRSCALRGRASPPTPIPSLPRKRESRRGGSGAGGPRSPSRHGRRRVSRGRHPEPVEG